MHPSAERGRPAGSLRRALLPQVGLGLQSEVAPEIELIGLRLGAPEFVLAVLGDPPALPRAVPKRRAEFSAGRHAAALALARFGCFEAVQRERSGAPTWPAGFVGSISHGAGLAVAVATSSFSLRGLGVDVEAWMTDTQCAEVTPRVLLTHEMQRLGAAFPELSPAQRATLGFSAKESLYKCLNPSIGEFIEFEDAEVVRFSASTPRSGKLWLALRSGFSAELPAGTVVPGCYALEPDRVETLICWSGCMHERLE